MIILSNKKMYERLERLWETRGNKKESFEDFLLDLCNEYIINTAELKKISDYHKNKRWDFSHLFFNFACEFFHKEIRVILKVKFVKCIK